MVRRFIPVIFAIFIFKLGLGQETDPVFIEAEIQPPEIVAGWQGELIVLCDISSEFHVSDASSGMFSVLPEPQQGFQFGEPVYPEGEAESYGVVYRGRISVTVPISVTKKVGPGQYKIAVQVKFQSCEEAGMICYPPDEKTVESHVSIVSATASTPASATGDTISDRLDRALAKGSILAFLLVFLGGMLTSLTPCVYPMIPITIAVIGAQAAGGKLKGFILSLFYVLGIAITFSTLGVIAAKTGSLFGSVAQHPITIIIIASIFFIMGLSMLGVFVMQMPSSIASRLAGRKGKGFIGALLTGLVAGLVVSPCISPLLVVILTWVARTGSVLLGIGLLFSFSLGLGVLFILIGTFSGILKTLPKSGGWMEVIERGFGILLVVLALVFLKPIFPSWMYLGVWSVFFIVFGTFIGAFLPLEKDIPKKKKLGKAVGIIAVLVGAFLLFFSLAEWRGFGKAYMSENMKISGGSHSRWVGTDVEGFSQAEVLGKPVLMDFFAEWCPACRELDEKTWPDESVQSQLDHYVAIKLDLTKTTEESKALLKKYNVIGMPTVILFDSRGNELSRFEGFKPPDEVAQLLQRFREGNA